MSLDDAASLRAANVFSIPKYFDDRRLRPRRVIGVTVVSYHNEVIDFESCVAASMVIVSLLRQTAVDAVADRWRFHLSEASSNISPKHYA